MFNQLFMVPVLLVALVLSLAAPQLVIAQSTDREAPEIGNLEIVDIEDTSITITWETDEDADSAVNYGLQPDYGIARIPLGENDERTAHSVTLDNLEPGRTYYFRVVSADENGNQGISADYRIVTAGTPQSGDGTNNGDGPQDGTGQGEGDSPDPES